MSELRIEVKGQMPVFNAKLLLPKLITEYTPLEKRVNLAEAIYSERPLCPDCQLWADAGFQNGGPAVAAFLQIPGTVLMKNRKDYLDLEVQFYLIGPRNIYDFSCLQASLELKNEKLRSRLSSSGMKLWSVLLGKQEDAQVRAVIFDLESGVIYSHRALLASPSGGLTISQPFVPSTNFDWLILPAPENPQSRRGASFDYPYRSGNDYFFPDLSPKLHRNSGNVFFIRFYQLGPQKRPPIRVLLVSPDSKTVEIQDFGLLQNPVAIEPDGMELFWKLKSLPSLPPGPYRLRVAVTDAARGTDIIRELPVQIFP